MILAGFKTDLLLSLGDGLSGATRPAAEDVMPRDIAALLFNAAEIDTMKVSGYHPALPSC